MPQTTVAPELGLFSDFVHRSEANELRTGDITRAKEDLIWLLSEKLGVSAKTPGFVDLAPIHYEIAEWMDEKIANKAPDQRLFMLILIPRGHLKSTVITAGKTTQLVIQDPNTRVLLHNAVWDNSRKFLSVVKNWLKDDFCREEVGIRLTRETQDEITVVRSNKAIKEPTVDTSGLEKALASKHYKWIFFDDLVNRENVGNEDQIRKVKLNLIDLFSLLEPDGIACGLGTRWHDADLYGDIMDTASSFGADFHVFHAGATKNGRIRTRRVEGRDEPYLEEGAKIQFPPKYTEELLCQLYRDLGSYEFFCNPAETPILMADWSVKPISEVVVGDEIVGFDFNDPNQRRTLKKSRVVNTHSRVAPTVSLTMESGRTIRCTPDHKWYTGYSPASGKPQYMPPIAGRRLMMVLSTDDHIPANQLGDFRYLAGLLDGEGSCRHGAISVAQSPTSNPEVCSELHSLLQRLELNYKDYEYERPGLRGSTKTSCLRMTVINGGKQTKFDVLRYGRPAKAQHLIDNLWDRPGRMVALKDRIASISDPGPQEPVFALETSTGNYIAWGYCSSNSQYYNETIDDDNATFKAPWIEDNFYQEIEAESIPMNHYLLTDFAISEEQYADFTAFDVVGLAPDNRFYVRLAERMKSGDPDAIIKRLLDIVVEWDVQRIAVETKSFQKVISKYLEREKRNRGIWVPVVEMNRGENNNRTKELRIKGLQPFFEGGQFRLRADMTHLIDELKRFPRGKHDDLIDALADAPEIARIAPSVQTKARSIHGTFAEYMARQNSKRGLAGIPGNEHVEDAYLEVM